MRRLFSILSVLLFVSVGVFAQDDTWYLDKPIKEIQLVGLNKVKKADVEAVTNQYLNKNLTLELNSALMDALWNLDYFETIEPEARPFNAQKTQVIIVLNLTEKPLVDSLEFLGNQKVGTANLLETISTKSLDVANAGKILADEQAILKLYREKGYPDTRVKGALVEDKERKRLIVRFTITEGVQLLIKKINFTGNTAFSENALKPLFSLKEEGFLQNNVFEEAKLLADIETLRRSYQDKGFVDVNILGVDRKKDPANDPTVMNLTLTISIKEGDFYTFSGLSFTGNKIFSTEKLNSLVWLKKGDVLNLSRFAADFNRVTDLYYENGYIFNSFNKQEIRDTENKSIAFVLEITERERAHIESITVEGNTKTKDYVLLRELPLESGDVFSKTKIMDGLRNLYNLQYFSSILPDTPRGSAENLINLVIKVEEQSTANIQFGVSFAGISKPGEWPINGLIKWNDTNFLGMGQTVNIDLNAAPDKQSLTLGFTENWLLGQRWSAGVQLDFTHELLSTYQDIIAPIFTTDDVPDPYTSLSDFTNAGFVPNEGKMTYDTLDVSLSLNTGYVFKTGIGDIVIATGYTIGLTNISYDSDKYRPYQQAIRDNLNTLKLSNRVYWKYAMNGVDLIYNPQRGYFFSERITLAGLFDVEAQRFFFMKDQSEERLDILNLASGAKVLALFYLLAKNSFISPSNLLIIDEPENHLHPEWQVRLAELLIDLVCDGGVKVLVTSHSPYFIAAVKEFSTKRNILNTKTNLYFAELGENGSTIKNVQEYDSKEDQIFKSLYGAYEFLDKEMEK